MPRITAIELENFQSIGQRTRLDLKPITLLFGPNSAGKSAVFDAIELIRNTLDPSLADEKRISHLVDRWARWVTPTDTVRETFLAVEFMLDMNIEPRDFWDRDLGIHSSKSNWPSFIWDSADLEYYGMGRFSTARIELRFVIDQKKDYEPLCFISESCCYLNDKPILCIVRSLTVDGESYVKKPYKGGAPNTRYLVLPMSYEGMFVNADIRLPRRKTSTGTLEFESYVGDILSNASPFSMYSGGGGEIELTMLSQNATDIFFHFGSVFAEIFKDSPELVRSDRRTPTPQEALALVDFNLGGWWSRDSRSASSPALLLKDRSEDIDPHFKGMAELAHADLLIKASNDDFWGGSHAAGYIKKLTGLAERLERINAHLERSLFREKLYRLGCESILMVPLDLGEDDPRGYYTLSQPAAVRLLLRDDSGMKLELQDVGSGIPYILPVLFSATSGGISTIQQPELHLHPALQSSVADIFIEEINENTSVQFLIETHSEHLLLRVLRRIRDTEKNKSLSTSLALDNSRVSVYYFDPKVGGETLVSSLPISPLGDFYTDWPRGFFEERNDDLFDED